MGLSVSALAAACCSGPGGWSLERRDLGRRGQQGGLLRCFRASLALRHLGLDVRAGSAVPGLRVSPSSTRHSQPRQEPPPLLLAKQSPVEMTQTLLQNPGIRVMRFLADPTWAPPSPGGLSPHPEHVATTREPPGPGEGARAGPQGRQAEQGAAARRRSGLEARGAAGGCAAPRHTAPWAASCPRHGTASSSTRRRLWVEAGHTRNPGLAHAREGDGPDPSCFRKMF